MSTIDDELNELNALHDKAATYDALIQSLDIILKKEIELCLQYDAGRELRSTYTNAGVTCGEDVVTAICNAAGLY